MSRVDPTIIISHWYNRADGLQQSSDGFYREVEKALSEHNIEHIKVERVNWSEGGIFSSKREYLQVRCGGHVFHVCAAPFGNGALCAVNEATEAANYMRSIARPDQRADTDVVDQLPFNRSGISTRGLSSFAQMLRRSSQPCRHITE